MTLIIRHDATGLRTATFGTDGSTAIKFPSGAATLSTAANSIDVVTIFNDGTAYLGNIANSYSLGVGCQDSAKAYWPRGYKAPL